MSNVVFELFAKLGLDSSEYEKGLGDAKSKASSIGGAIGNGLMTAAKIGGAAIATATAAVGAFAASSVKAGADFDKSMSQVAATMGLTMDEMANQTGKVDLAWGTFSGNLREYAQEMGKNTAFSATQAADALNYMALAGYDTQTSMEMLPNVLNLAAAGNMDLARASDMVTDTQTAFGISLDRTSQMVDEMAKAASTGNTSVEQLGDAFLVVGGLAQEMSGGMVQLSDGTSATYDNVQELEIALTAMANAGIKGSEAGTHMRNMLLKLASPTKEGVAQFEALGVTVFDSEGKMRSLSDIMGDLNGSLSNLTQEQKLQAISDIFNTRDTAAAEALLNAVGEDWDSIAESILDADGAAQQMANTQLDNLAGDVTLFQSALEGAKIAVSDGLTPTLRKFVQFGTSGLSKITDAFQKDGLSGAMEAFGDVIADGINMIVDMAPQAIDAGMKLLGAVGQGILNNLPAIIDAATQIIPMLGQGIMQALPALLDGAIQIVAQLGTFLIESIPKMIPAIIQLVTQLGLMLAENAPALIDGVIALMTGIAVALIENLPLLLDAAIQITIALAQAIIENLPVFVDAVVQILMAIVNLIVEYGGMFLTEVGNMLVNLVTSVGTGMSNMLNTFVTWLSQLPTTMAYWAGYAIGSFIKFVIELPGKLLNIFNDAMTNVITFGNNFWNKAKEMAKNFFDSIVNGVKELPNKMRQLGSDLVQAVENLPRKFMDIGSNIVEGLWDGISAGWDWLTDSVADLANSLLEGAKAALGIHSPSKEFAWVGRMVDEGFVKGIDDYAYKVDDALNALTTIPDAEVQVNGGSNNQIAPNNVIMNIYGAVGQDVNELADKVSKRLNDVTGRRMVAMGVVQNAW